MNGLTIAGLVIVALVIVAYIAPDPAPPLYAEGQEVVFRDSGLRATVTTASCNASECDYWLRLPDGHETKAEAWEIRDPEAIK